MAKRKICEVSKKERQNSLEEFFEIVAKIKNKDQASKFFKDLLTPSEALMLTRRISIAKLLLKGKNCRDIAKELKVGTNTVGSVNRWLHAGFGGYMSALKDCKTKREFKNKILTTEWEKIKKKYPAHFLIFNTLDKFKK